MWKFVNDKYIIPAHGRKATLARIDDAWRRYKTSIKKKYFSKYPNLRERLKHRPKRIPKPHLKKLMIYWGINTVQDICKKNAVNRTKQKYIYTVWEQGILLGSRQNCVQRRRTDQTSLNQRCSLKPAQVGKEKKWIKILKMLLLNFMIPFKTQMNVLGKLFNQYLAKKRLVECVAWEEWCLLKQANPDLDDEALDSIMENAMDDDNGASTSTQMHDLDKETHPTFEEGELEVEDDE
ncbi:hypothetical protein QL285_094357 [Trifolium repens]|nr:hypothetical protein QL285_094357 [Trifolium repens]